MFLKHLVFDKPSVFCDYICHRNGLNKLSIKFNLGGIYYGNEVSKEDAIIAGKEALGDKLAGTVVKEIYVPGKIINIVVKPN